MAQNTALASFNEEEAKPLESSIKDAVMTFQVVGPHKQEHVSVHAPSNALFNAMQQCLRQSMQVHCAVQYQTAETSQPKHRSHCLHLAA